MRRPIPAAPALLHRPRVAAENRRPVVQPPARVRQRGRGLGGRLEARRERGQDGRRRIKAPVVQPATRIRKRPPAVRRRPAQPDIGGFGAKARGLEGPPPLERVPCVSPLERRMELPYRAAMASGAIPGQLDSVREPPALAIQHQERVRRATSLTPGCRVRVGPMERQMETRLIIARPKPVRRKAAAVTGV